MSGRVPAANLRIVDLCGTMSDSDNRNITRNSLFILAEIRLSGRAEEHRVKVRNLSSGGMMGEGDVKVTRGEPVEINLRNVGWVEGSVAWVQDNRFGVSFADDVDPTVIKVPAAAPEGAHIRLLKNPYQAKPAAHGPTRKII